MPNRTQTWPMCDEHIRMAQRLEELGWHSYFVIEHQNSPVGRITPATVFLTAVAELPARFASAP